MLRRIRDERGVVSVVTAITLAVLLVSVAMAVDIGHASFRKKDLQKLADVIALDAVRALGDRRDPLRDPATHAHQLALESAQRNGLSASEAAAGVTTEIGVFSISGSENAFTPTPIAPNAVQVSVASTVDYAFMPGSLDLVSSAVATNDFKAGLTVGSSLVSFDSDDVPLMNQFLGATLGMDLELDAGSYDGLARSKIKMKDLFAELGFGSPDEIADGEMTYAEMLHAAARAAQQDGDPGSAEAAVTLEQMAKEVEADPDAAPQRYEFDCDDVERSVEEQPAPPGSEPPNPDSTNVPPCMMDLEVGGGDDFANAEVGLLELVVAGAQAANGRRLADIPGLSLAIDGVLRTDAQIGVIEAPVYAFGPVGKDANGRWITQAHTAQMTLQFFLRLEQSLTVGERPVPLTLPIALSFAGADAALTGLDCGTSITEAPVWIHGATRAFNASVGQRDPADMVVKQPITPGELPIEVPEDVDPGLIGEDGESGFRVTGNASIWIPGTETSPDLYFSGPFERDGQRIGDTSPSLDSLNLTLQLDVQTGSSGASAAEIESQVRSILAPVISVLEEQLLDPLASSPMGLTMAGATVTNPEVWCHGRKLAR